MISPGHKRRLNHAMHELRRPLQALTLLHDGVPSASPPGAARRGLLELAAAALAELDGAVNGGAVQRPIKEVSCRELVLASLERWRPVAGDGIRVYWDAGAALVEGDPIGMAQAFDNLIANAIEHGGPPLVITGATVAGRLRVTVANGAPGGAAEQDFNLARSSGARGNGVAIVSRIASAHRGRFALCRSGSGCVAALELPLAEGGLARAA